MSTKPLTGRKVFAIVAGAFAVIISVNVFMAWSAIRTFPGLEVKNSYVASQSFDADRTAQEALGWQVETYLDGDELVLSLMTKDGLPVQVAELNAVVGRLTQVKDDFEPDFVRAGGVYRAPVELAPGAWALRLTAKAEDGTEFRKRLSLYVKAN